MILTGVLAIMIPPVAGIAVLVVVAWLLMFSGAAHLVFAWHTRTAGGMVWELLLAWISMTRIHLRSDGLLCRARVGL
jgi:uncharacterized membrane protein HdeD (DUF308 family)